LGFTHYWTYNQRAATFRDEDWHLLQTFAKKAIDEVSGKKTKTAGGFHSDIPVKVIGKMTKSTIMLDGDPGCETLVLVRGLGYTMQLVGSREHGLTDHGPGARLSDFCKTARCPYDVVVVAMLEAAAQLGLLSEYSSDGDPLDLQQGRQLFYKVWPKCKTP
jgi:hypothetical protein